MEMNDSKPRINETVKNILTGINEGAFDGTVKEGFKRKFTVINEHDRSKFLTDKENEKLENVLFYYLGKIEEGRAKEGKEPFNSYVVINLDEAYTDEVVEIMKRHGHWG